VPGARRRGIQKSPYTTKIPDSPYTVKRARKYLLVKDVKRALYHVNNGHWLARENLATGLPAWAAYPDRYLEGVRVDE
jgi:hypothetical protein